MKRKKMKKEKREKKKDKSVNLIPATTPLITRIQAKTPYMRKRPSRKRPSRKRPIFLTFHNSVFLLLFFLLYLLFLSRSPFLSYLRS